MVCWLLSDNASHRVVNCGFVCVYSVLATSLGQWVQADSTSEVEDHLAAAHVALLLHLGLFSHLMDMPLPFFQYTCRNLMCGINLLVIWMYITLVCNCIMVHVYTVVKPLPEEVSLCGSAVRERLNHHQCDALPDNSPIRCEFAVLHSFCNTVYFAVLLNKKFAYKI